MRLTEHIADKLQATIQARVMDRTKVVREQALTQVNEAVRAAAKAVIAEVLAESADMVISVDQSTGVVRIESDPVLPATPPTITPPVEATPTIDTRAEETTPATDPLEVTADLGRGAA